MLGASTPPDCALRGSCPPCGTPGSWPCFWSTVFPSGFESGPPATSLPTIQTPQLALCPWEATVTQLLKSEWPCCRHPGTH